jgi:hypothetical protein
MAGRAPSAPPSPGGSSIGSRHVFFGLLALAAGLLWVRPGDVAPIREGLEQALEPGAKLVRWGGDQWDKWGAKAHKSLPPAETLSGRSTDHGRVARSSSDRWRDERR